jgi:hypothetical protein
MIYNFLSEISKAVESLFMSSVPELHLTVVLSSICIDPGCCGYCRIHLDSQCFITRLLVEVVALPMVL